jgi:hypothetical protein
VSTAALMDAPAPVALARPGAVRRVVLLGLLLNLGLVAFCAATYGGGAEWFVKFGEDGAYTPYAREVLGDDLLVPLEDGHDGQGYWLQARDPLLVDGNRMAATFDRPAYRAQRMLYPTLAAPFRLVGEDAVLWGLVVVNLVAVGFGTLWATRLAQATGAPERAGLAFALNPVIAISLVMDFADALALAGLVGVALAVHRQRWGWAVAAGVAALLAKDVTLAALAALVLLWPVAGAVRRRWAIVVIPALAALGWAVYVRWRLGWPASDIEEFTPVPLWGYVDAYRRGWSQHGNWGDALFSVFLLVAAAVVVVRWWRRRNVEMTMALPFALLVPFLTATVTDLAINSFRVIAPALTFGVIDWYAETAGRAQAASDATHSSTRSPRMGSVTAPWARTASWKPLMSKRSPS